MTSLQSSNEIAQINKNAKMELKKLTRPLSAYQYYTKAMLEKWNHLDEDVKKLLVDQSEKDKNRYNDEKNAIKNECREEIKKLKIFLCYSGDRVPCIGLDNGFTRYTIRGPVDSIELFTEQEKQKLIERGVPENYIGKYKSVNGIMFNWRAAKKWNVMVYGGSQNSQSSWGRLRENYQGKEGSFTTYNNYKGETWTEKY